jgi:hypothetical protein
MKGDGGTKGEENGVEKGVEKDRLMPDAPKGEPL